MRRLSASKDLTKSSLTLGKSAIMFVGRQPDSCE